MTESTRLDERVTNLELEMAEVRYLATKANKDVSDFKTVLGGHTGVINAIRDDQLEQGKRLARVEKKVDNVEKEMRDGFTKVDENFAKVDENFAKVERKFELLHRGQDRITDLLTRHLGEWTEETRAGGTDE